MATLYPPVLEAKAQAIPYAEQASLENYYNIEFKMPDVNSIEDIGHIQVSIKYQSTNESAVNRNRSPDGNVLYFNRAESHDYFHRKDNGNYEISIPYLCFDGSRPQQGVTYCIQVRFGNARLWTEGSGISEQDFGGFAGWRAVQVSAVPSRFGEWSNVQTVYCYGSAAVTLTANYHDFVPELEYRYAPVLDDPLEQIKIVYEYADLYGSTFNTLVFNGQRQQDGVYTLKVKLPIAPVQRILVSLEAITKNNTIRGRTLTIVPLKYSKIFPVIQHNVDENGDEIPLLEDVSLQGEENEDGCLAKKVSIPAEKYNEDGDIIPDDPNIYKAGSTLSIYRSNLYSLETVKIIEGLNADRGSSTIFKDYSVEMGEDYQYIAVLKDADGIAYALVEDIYDWGYENPGYARLMHMDSIFLTTRNHQLRLQGNANVTSFKRNTQDQFQTTLGSQYPFYQRNAKMNYRTFTLSGLITANHDPTGSFLRNDNENGLWWDDENGSRLVVLNRDLYATKQFSISRARMYDYLQQNPKIEALDERVRSEIFNRQEELYDIEKMKKQYGAETFYDEYLYRNIIRQVSTDKTDENVYYERKFRDFVMLWLSDGKPKLFRSETEGNMIVMISGASLTPQDKSSRMVYNLSCTVTEIAEYNMQNLLDYNLIPFSFQTSLITALPRNLTYGDKVDPQDYISIIGLNSSFQFYFTYDNASNAYIVNKNADLDKLNEVINSVNEYTFIRGDIDPDVYSGLVYQYNKIYNIPDSLAGVPIKQIATWPAVKGGSGDYTFSVPVLDGQNLLPEGITLDPDTGIISGTPILHTNDPTKPKSVILNVHDNSSTNPDVSKRDAQMTILVGVIYPQLILNATELVGGSGDLLKATIAEAKIGTNITPINLSSAVLGGYPFSVAEEGQVDYDYLWDAEGLPQGFTINNYGVITGAYTDLVEPGEATIKITDAAGQQIFAKMKFGQGYFPIYFYPSIDFNIPYSEEGVEIDPIDVSSGVTGGKTNITDEYPHGYKFSAKGLPAGLTIDEKTGIISGAPEHPGNAVTATITATDFDSPPSSAEIVIMVQAQLEKFQFIYSNRLDIAPLGYEPGTTNPVEMMIGEVIKPIQVLIQGDQDPNSDDPDAIITYDMAEVRGGLRYTDPPYYRFSSEYLIPDFTITNQGVISGRAQVASEKRTGILKVMDARNEVRPVQIQIAKISSRMTFVPTGTYSLPDTYVNANKNTYKVQIPVSDIHNGNHPLTYTFDNLPAGMAGSIWQEPQSQKEYIVIEKDPNSANWPSAAKSAGYINITVTDTKATAEDEEQKIVIKVPYGTIVPKLEWNQDTLTLPPLSAGQEKKVYITGVTGGVYPYTIKIIAGNPDPWVIRQTEGAEQDPNQFYFYGKGNGATPSGSVTVQITDASGQTTTPKVFTKNATYDGLTFSLKNSFQNVDLIVGRSMVPGTKGSIQIIEGHGGDGNYTYGISVNNNNEVIPGIILDSKLGTIEGTPTKKDNPANLTGYFTIKDGTGAYGSWDKVNTWYSPVVSDVPRYALGVANPYTEKNLVINQWYSQKFFEDNNNRKLVFSLSGDPLPAGLNFSTTTGIISGTCTGIADRRECVITATIPADEYNTTPVVVELTVIFPGVSGYMDYVLVPPGFTINNLQVGVDVGKISVSDGLSGGTAPFTWQVSGNLPAGLKLEWDSTDTSKAWIAGIPTTKSDTGGTFRITVTDASGQSKYQDIPWTGVYDKITITGGPIVIPEQDAYITIEEINVLDYLTITGGTSGFTFDDNGGLSPYDISSTGIISGYTGSASQEAKTVKVTVKDGILPITAEFEVQVGKINGAMTYDTTKTPPIPAGTINTTFSGIDLKVGVVGGGSPVFKVLSLPSGWPMGSITVDSNGIISGTRPSSNVLAGTLTVQLTDSTTSVTNIVVSVPVGAVSGETLSYTPDTTLRAIPAGTRNTTGTLDIRAGFKGLADPTFTVTGVPSGWQTNQFSVSKQAVISFTRPSSACAAGELKLRVQDSGQTIDITIPVGAVS